MISNIRHLLVGHSFVGPFMPAMLETAVTAMEGTGQVEAQIVNCAPIIYYWTPRRTGCFRSDRFVNGLMTITASMARVFRGVQL
jgi:hypothetical protein